MVRCLSIILLVCCPSVLLSAQCGSDIETPVACNPVVKDGITITFDTDYVVGQFVNGDYWALENVADAGVTIDSMSPAYVSTPGSEANGWEVNPPFDSLQGYDNDCYWQTSTPSLVPSLPYTSTNTTESIVKAVSATNNSDRSCLQTSVVLTIVSSTPASNSFRPPYIGTNKPFYTQDDIQTGLLPSLASVGTPPSLQDVIDDFDQLRMEDSVGALRALRAQDNGTTIDGYKPDYIKPEFEALLRVMLNDDYSTKLPALSYVLQFALDNAYHLIEGFNKPDSGGHEPTHWVWAAFGAVMFDISTAKSAVLAATLLHEYNYNQASAYDGRTIWGEADTEANYWTYITTEGAARSIQDPYGFIDGGAPTRSGYQLIVSQSWVGTVLVATLVPEMQALMTGATWSKIYNYVHRWQATGRTFQPDPCAPAGSSYGVDYGPDGSGSCIKDADLDYYNSPTDFACTGGQECGRFVSYDDNKDGEGNVSAFVTAMWDEYKDGVDSPTHISLGSGFTIY